MLLLTSVSWLEVRKDGSYVVGFHFLVALEEGDGDSFQKSSGTATESACH